MIDLAKNGASLGLFGCFFKERLLNCSCLLSRSLVFDLMMLLVELLLDLGDLVRDVIISFLALTC